MSRFHSLTFTAVCFLIGSSIVYADDQPSSDKDVSPETIAKAIRELGSSRFVVRERATRFLWEAGADAEAALLKAAKSGDPEVSRRAKDLLEKFQWGIYPNTPKLVLDLIERFRAGNPNERRKVATELMDLGSDGYVTLGKLLKQIKNVDERDYLSARLIVETRKHIPELLVRGELDEAQALLEVTLIGYSSEAAKDYAAFLYMAKRVEPAIERYEAQLENAKGEDHQRIARILVHLYRVQQDWEKALAAAQASEDENLEQEVLWESSDWEALSKNASRERSRYGNSYGVIAAYHRLAGNQTKFQETIQDIRNQIDLNTEDRYELRMLAEALLLNNRPNLAIEALRDHRRNLAMVFELLCTQLRYKEAFELVDAVRGDDTINDLEAVQLRLQRARILHLLGEQESARQLFAGVIDMVNRDNDWNLAHELVETEARLGQKDLALTHAAECMAILLQRDGEHTPERLLEPLFEGHESVAVTLWYELRRREPGLPPAALMKRIRDLLAGKAKDNLEKWVGGLERTGIRPAAERYAALGEIYLAAGDKDKALRYFLDAAQRGETGEHWRRLGDLLMDEHRYEEAAKRYAQAWEQNQTQPLPLFLQGLALIQAGREREGNRLLDVAHWLPLGNEQTREQIAEELSKRGADDAAEREVQLVLNTGWYQNWFLGNILNRAARKAIAERRFADAARYYQKATVGCMRTGATFIRASAYIVVPQAVVANEARALLASGKIPEALTVIDENLKVLPGNSDLALSVVPELDRQERKTDADRIFNIVWSSYEEVCKQYPNSAWAHNAAAWLGANCRRELERSLAMAEKAVQLAPERAGYLDTLAEVHFRRDEKDKAIEFMKKCIEMEPENQYFRKQLARFQKGDINSPPPEEE